MDRLAELAALDSFAWIVEDPANNERIVSDTYAEHAGAIAEMKAEIVSFLSEFVKPEDLAFDRLENGVVRVSLAVLVTPDGFVRETP